MGPQQETLRFSVVVPAHNEVDDLGATISSVKAQDFLGGVEVVVVDNGSTDGTGALARHLGVRVVDEPVPGICAARQRGTEAARGEIVVSTDADTVHPTDWLRRLDAVFTAHPAAVAVAGPCRYMDPPWWAAVLPQLWFRGVAALYAWTGWVGHVTAANVAFRREGFPGYDVRLTQGGDEADLLRRLRRWGLVVWDDQIVVDTSSRRVEQGFAHTILISFGLYYFPSNLLNRLFGRMVIGRAPVIRRADRSRVRRDRLRWRWGLMGGAVLVIAARTWRRSSRAEPAEIGADG